jgi:hypothetical protein
MPLIFVHFGRSGWPGTRPDEKRPDKAGRFKA